MSIDPETEEAIAALDNTRRIFEQLGLHKLSGNDLVDGIGRALFRIGVNSEDRASEMLWLTQEVEPAVFWKVFNDNWSLCDDTWELNDILIETLDYNSYFDSRSVMDEQQKQFLESLPSRVRVYRGCSSDRIRGIAWTTDENVAASYARGHRGIAVPNPVIVCAKIPQEAIFTVILDRGESEIVLHPRFLTNVRRPSMTARAIKARDARMIRQPQLVPKTLKDAA